ncbi:hemolysin family protein [Ruania rhizosphaerae]|uniref:hemolysin family protein n=1 Tax=Ruania rhizosphaerae TaxID=1840413 RepID=UPI001357DF54|nr:hemolysin family protein [Ruania rhizosphaerae]
MTVLTLLLGILVILAIIAANGYFVAQEFAYMSVDRSRLGARAEAGDAAAGRALTITRRTSFMLSGAQLGITVTGLLIGYVAEPLVGTALGELLGGVGVPAAVGISIGTIGALAISTVVQMIFGELFPKNLAIANAEPLALALARSTTIYLAVFGWLITVFDHAANGLLRLFRIEPVHDVDSSATPNDLEHIVADSRESGHLPEELSILLDRILDFPDQDVEHAMIPRSRVAAVPAHLTLAELRERMAEAHTRYPVVDDRDQAVGVVQLSDLLATDLPDESPVTNLMREPVVIPTAMMLPDALTELTRSKNELACVIDEYGGFTGILTVEDMAEELIGEVTDEHDHEQPATIRIESEDCWVLDGDVHIDEVERTIGHDLPRGDYETIAGLLLDVHGQLLEPGESVEVVLPIDPADLADDEPDQHALTAQVLEIERHVPSTVRLQLHLHDRSEVEEAGS